MMDKAADDIANGKQIAGSTTQDLPPPPGDVADPQANVKATKHELEKVEKKAPIPGNKIDEVKSVNVESRPHNEQIGEKAVVKQEEFAWDKDSVHRKSDFAPKDKDVPVTYEGAGVRPFALAQEMAFAQIEARKPHKKSKKHHRRHKHHWVDEQQPGPMNLPKDPLDEDEPVDINPDDEVMEDAPIEADDEPMPEEAP